MDLKPFALLVALMATGASAAEFGKELSTPASGSTAWRIENGMTAFPEPPTYGTRTDVYVDDSGRIKQVQRSYSDDANDQTNFYDYESGLDYGDSYDEYDEDE